MNKDLVDKNDLNFEMALNLGNLQDVVSFGGNSLAQNAENTERALAKMEPINRIWGKSNSEFMTKAMVIGGQHSPERSLRQLASELQKKKHALDESKHKIVLKQLDIDLKYEGLEKEEHPTRKKIIEVEISQLKCEIANSMVYIEGAMKSVLQMEKLYDVLLEKVGHLDEEAFEKSEIKSHLNRSLSQSLQDLRDRGSISKGEQIYMRELGLNVSRVKRDLASFLEFEKDTNSYSNIPEYDFINEFSEKLIPVCKHNLEHKGFDTEFDSNLGFKPNYKEN